MCARRAVVLAVTVAMVLAAEPLLAQGARRGGGGHARSGGRPGGGGHSGGSYAVPRGAAPSRPAYAPRGGVAAARHPRAGTGSYYYRPGYGRPSYGRPSYGRYYRPYYGGGRYYGNRYRNYGSPYYSSRYYGYGYGYYAYPSASFYLGFGSPYYTTGWWPYGYYAPSYSVSYYGYPGEGAEVLPEGQVDLRSDSGGAYAPPRSLGSSRDAGRVRLEVRPEDASVYVDDEFRGNARDTKFLTLRAGRHSIELVRPGFTVTRREVDVRQGETSDVLVELQRP